MHLSGTTGASALMMRSTTRWIWENRASAATGAIGLKIDPSGAVTFTGRKLPSFAGICSASVYVSSSSARKAK